jgi:hypothetical protein
MDVARSKVRPCLEDTVTVIGHEKMSCKHNARIDFVPVHDGATAKRYLQRPSCEGAPCGAGHILCEEVVVTRLAALFDVVTVAADLGDPDPEWMVAVGDAAPS